MQVSPVRSENPVAYLPAAGPVDGQAVIDSALRILEQRLRGVIAEVNSPNDAKNFLQLRLSTLEHEVFAVMFLDNRHRLIAFEELFRGTIDGAAVYSREVVKAALYQNAAAVILSHNHPSGDTSPSEADRRITARLREALGLIDVRVLDHIIVSATNTYSFAENGGI